MRIKLERYFFDECERAFLDTVIGTMSDNESDKHQQGEGERYVAWRISEEWFSRDILRAETDTELDLLETYINCIKECECCDYDIAIEGATFQRPVAGSPEIVQECYWTERAYRKPLYLVEIVKKHRALDQEDS